MSKDAQPSALAAGMANAIAGSLGGAIAMSILYPFETMRLRMQAQTRDENGELQYSSMADCARQILDEEGIKGFYVRLAGSVFGVALANLVYYFWANFFKYRLYGKRSVTPRQNLVSSCLGGICNVLMLNPYWVANTQMMLNQRRGRKGKYKNVLDAIYQIYQEKGLSDGPYSGLVPSIMLISNPCVQFVVYESLLLRLKLLLKKGQLSSYQYFLLGAFAKFCATITTYPLQVIKTQFQKEDCPYANVSDAVQKITLNYTSVEGLYQGMGAKLTQTVSNTALMFVLYERILLFSMAFSRNLVDGASIRKKIA